MVTKSAKEYANALGCRRLEGDMDIELAVDAIGMADHLDGLVLSSGDGDLRSPLQAVQRKGKRVFVVSSTSTQPGMIADEFRRQADEFGDLTRLASRIARDPGERQARPGERHPWSAQQAAEPPAGGD